MPLYASISHRPHRHHPTPGTAVEFLRSAIRRRPGEITLLTIGPFTNVALLFALDPEMPSLLKAIVSMAGVYFPHERATETNVLIDPVAAAMVFQATARQSSAPHTLFGLNVTTHCTLPAAEVRARLRAAIPPAPALTEMAEAYFRRRRHVTLNDPLAAVAVFVPEVCTYEGGAVTMRADRLGEDVARTYFAPGRATPRASSNQRVARGVRLERFFDEFFDTLRGVHTPGRFPLPAEGI